MQPVYDHTHLPWSSIAPDGKHSLFENLAVYHGPNPASLSGKNARRDDTVLANFRFYDQALQKADCQSHDPKAYLCPLDDAYQAEHTTGNLCTSGDLLQNSLPNDHGTDIGQQQSQNHKNSPKGYNYHKFVSDIASSLCQARRMVLRQEYDVG